MSKFGGVFLTALLLGVAPVAQAEVPRHIAQEAAWGCRDRSDLIDLLFLGLSTSFDNKLAIALADGRCVYFNAGESVTIVGDGGHGIVKVQRGGATPVTYWTAVRNLD